MVAVTCNVMTKVDGQPSPTGLLVIMSTQDAALAAPPKRVNQVFIGTKLCSISHPHGWAGAWRGAGRWNLQFH